MRNKFKDVPVDEDTRIQFRNEAKLGNYDVLYEIWSWEGISAESIIFASDDVSDLTDEELEQEVRKSPLVKMDFREFLRIIPKFEWNCMQPIFQKYIPYLNRISGMPKIIM